MANGRLRTVYDPDTGHWLYPEEVDTTQFDLVPADQVEAENADFGGAEPVAELPEVDEAAGAPSYLGNRFKRGLGSGITGIANLIKEAEEYLGSPTSVGDWAIEHQRPYMEEREQVIQEADPNWIEEQAGHVLEGGGAMLPALAGGGPIGFSSLVTAQNFGNRLDRYRNDPTVAPGDAEKAAIAGVPADFALGLLPAAPAYNRALSGADRAILTGLGGEIQGGGGVVNDLLTRYMAKRGTPSVEQIQTDIQGVTPEDLESLRNEVLQGMGTGGATGLLAGAAASPRGVRAPTTEQAPIDYEYYTNRTSPPPESAEVIPSGNLLAEGPDQIRVEKRPVELPEGVPTGRVLSEGDSQIVVQKTVKPESLPVVQKPLKLDKVIHGESFPKVQEYVAKETGNDPGALQGLANYYKRRVGVEVEKPLGLPEPDFMTGDNFTMADAPAPKVLPANRTEFRPDDSINTVKPELKVAREPGTMIEGSPIVKLAVKDLTLSKDVPNFKRGASKDGVVEPLKGEFDSRGVAPIAVWQRVDGSQEVISGRHRLDLAKRSKKEKIDAQVFREMDGFSREDAMILDAEMNIRDEQGSVADYANFFRARQIDPATAERRGLLSRSKGIQGFSIAANLSDGVYSLHQSGRISDSQAFAIAESAPGNEALQNFGVRRALENATPDQIAASMKVFEKLNSGELALPPPEQTDMFGGGADPIQVLADKIGNKIAERKKLLKEDLLSLASAKRPELAAKGGAIKVNSKKTAARKTQAQKDLEQWERATTNPELMAKLRDEVVAESRPTIKDRLLSEGGSVVHPFNDLRNWLDSFKDFKDAPKEYKFFSNSLRRRFYTQGSIARRFPQFMPTYEAGNRFFGDTNEIAYNHSKVLAPYTAIPNKSKLNAALIHARKQGESFEPTPENLAALGLDERDMQGFMAVRKWADSMLDSLKQEALIDAEAKDVPAIQERFESLKRKNYVPFSRFGDNYLSIQTPDGQLVEYLMADTPGELVEAKRIAESQGMKTSFGKVLKNIKSEYLDISPEILAVMDDVDAGIPIEGFKKHFEQADLVPGFSMDLERSISDYTMSAARYISGKRLNRALKAELPNLASVELSPVRKHVEDYIKFLKTPTPKQAQMHRFFSMFYLANNVKTVAVNLTSTATVLPAILAKYTSGIKLRPEVYISKGLAKGSEYLLSAVRGSDHFAKKYPKIAAEIEHLKARGLVSAQEVTELAQRGRGGKGSYDKALFALNIVSENANRVIAAIAGYEAYPEAAKGLARRGLPVPPLRQFVEQVVTEANFNYTKADRPEFARGAIGSSLYIFKQWPVNYWRIVIGAMQRQELGTLARLVASMGALGGVGAIPLVGTFLKSAESAGIDWKKELRDALETRGVDPKVASDVIYGPATRLGAPVITGSLDVGGLAPGVEEGLLPSMMRGALGVLPDPAQRIGKAAWLYNEMDAPYRAVEAMMPETVKSLMMAYRMKKEGLRSPNMSTILKDPTDSEIAMRGMGFTTRRVAEAYEANNTKHILDKNARNKGNIDFKIGKALYEGDREKARSLFKEAQEKGLEVNLKQVAKVMKRPKGTEIENYKSLPTKARGDYLKVLKRQKELQ